MSSVLFLNTRLQNYHYNFPPFLNSIHLLFSPWPLIQGLQLLTALLPTYLPFPETCTSLKFPKWLWTLILFEYSWLSLWKVLSQLMVGGTWEGLGSWGTEYWLVPGSPTNILRALSLMENDFFFLAVKLLFSHLPFLVYFPFSFPFCHFFHW